MVSKGQVSFGRYFVPVLEKNFFQSHSHNLSAVVTCKQSDILPIVKGNHVFDWVFRLLNSVIR